MDSIKEAISSLQKTSTLEEMLKRFGETQTAAFQAAGANVGKMFAQFQSDAFTETLDRFNKLFAEALRRTHDALERVELLAELGWTLPMEMSLPEFQSLVMQEDLTVDGVDEWFLDYYSRDNGAEFNRLKNDLLQSDHLVFWKPLLEQVFDAFSRGQFAVCVPSLLSILEGSIAVPWKVAFAKAKERKKFFEIKISGQQADSVDCYLWKSVAAFVENVFEDSVTPNREYPLPKRHLILHGKSDPAQWNRGDCLRLLQAILTLEPLKDEMTGQDPHCR